VEVIRGGGVPSGDGVPAPTNDSGGGGGHGGGGDGVRRGRGAVGTALPPSRG